MGDVGECTSACPTAFPIVPEGEPTNAAFNFHGDNGVDGEAGSSASLLELSGARSSASAGPWGGNPSVGDPAANPMETINSGSICTVLLEDLDLWDFRSSAMSSVSMLGN